MTETFAERESALDSLWGTAEINAIFAEIDDARTVHDLPKIKVLEMGVGCGKAMVRLMNEWRIPNVKGIDFSDESVTYCKKKGLNVELMDAMNTSYANDEFNYVYGVHLIDAVPMEVAVKIVKESLRLAKKSMFVVAGTFDKDKLFKLVPNERHKVISNIVRYTRDATPYANHLLVFYRQEKSKKGEVEKNDRTDG